MMNSTFHSSSPVTASEPGSGPRPPLQLHPEQGQPSVFKYHQHTDDPTFGSPMDLSPRPDPCIPVSLPPNRECLSKDQRRRGVCSPAPSSLQRPWPRRASPLDLRDALPLALGMMLWPALLFFGERPTATPSGHCGVPLGPSVIKM